VRGVNWLGDAVMTTPALVRLREAKPGAFIALLTPAKLADLFQRHPAINQVMTFERSEGVFGVARRLRAGRFDTALILPKSPRSALEAFLARIPRRIGYRQPWRTALLTQKLDVRPGVVRMRKRSPAEIRRLIAAPDAARTESPPQTSHHVHDYLHLAAALGASAEVLPPTIHVDRSEVEAVRIRFGAPPAATGPAPLFGLNAGAEYGPAKRWPRERFIEAAIAIQRRTNCTWWIFGGPADRALADSIAREIEQAQSGAKGTVRCLAGQTTLRDLSAAMKACSVVLTNDTGPMHVAAAVGTRVVVPFGSTSPELTGPGLPGERRHALLKSQAICSPCFLATCPIDFRCMMGISVEAIVAAMLNPE
jgi:heptosyltransferase-2